MAARANRGSSRDHSSSGGSLGGGAAAAAAARLVSPSPAITLGVLDSLADASDDIIASSDASGIVIAVAGSLQGIAQDPTKSSHTSVAVALVVTATSLDSAALGAAQNHLGTETITNMRRLGNTSRDRGLGKFV